MRLAMITTMGALLLAAPVLAEEAPQCGHVKSVLKGLKDAGYKETVTTDEGRAHSGGELLGMFLVNAKGEWVEIWINAENDLACLKDTGEQWHVMPSQDASTPDANQAPSKVEPPKGGVTPDAPDANGSITF